MDRVKSYLNIIWLKAKQLPLVTGGLILASTAVFFCTWPVTVGNDRKLREIASDIAVVQQSTDKLLAEVNALNDLKKLKSTAGYRRSNPSVARLQLQSFERELVPLRAGLYKLKAKKQSLGKSASKIQSKNLFNKYGIGVSKFRIWQVFIYQFLHRGYLHLLWVMLLLCFLGANIERRAGKLVYSVLCLVCSISFILIYKIVVLSSALPLVGSSGVASGLAGFYTVMYFRDLKSNFRLFSVKVPRWSILLFWGAMLLLGVGDVPLAAQAPVFALGAGLMGLCRVSGLDKSFKEPEAVIKEESAKFDSSKKLLAAEAKIKAGKPIEAEILLKQIVSADPDCLDAYLALAALMKPSFTFLTAELKQVIYRIFEISAKFNKVQAGLDSYYAYREALGSDTGILSLKALLFLGRILEEHNDGPEAIFIYKKAIAEYSGDSLADKAYFTLGRLYAKGGLKGKASEIFNELLSRPGGSHYNEMIDKELI